MARIKSLYREYTQKSLIFLYPLLGIKRGSSTKPIGAYLSWANKYSEADCKFICVYHLRDDREFRVFEEVKLRGNKYFHEFFELEDGKGAYVFDFSEQDVDFWYIVRGKYSRLTKQHKATIMEFFKNHRADAAYIETYLYPKKYHKMYAGLLCCDVKDIPRMVKSIKKTGELCSAPDLEKETLTAKVKDLDISSINVNLLDKPAENS